MRLGMRTHDLPVMEGVNVGLIDFLDVGGLPALAEFKKAAVYDRLLFIGEFLDLKKGAVKLLLLHLLSSGL